METQTVNTTRKSAGAKTCELTKVSTYVAGLDDVLKGGVPAGRTTLVNGGPGTGKTIMGLEFLYRGALTGEPGIYVTFEERSRAVRENALTMGWDLAPLEEEGKIFVLEAYVDPELVLSGDFSLKGLLAMIEGKTKAMGARRVVIDALDVLLRLFDDPTRERNELYLLHHWLNEREITAMMTVKAVRGQEPSSRYEFLDFMADCVIHLDQRILDQVKTRRMCVVKYRGSDFASNEYPFVITGNGICVMPVTSIELQHSPLGTKVTTGNAALDRILGGGYRRSSSILVSGSSGTGKTTLVCTFARAACARREKVLYVSFEESREALFSGMLSPGIDLQPALNAGTLQVQTAMPESMGAEVHLLRQIKSIDLFCPDHVIVDAISSCKRMGSEQAAFEYTFRLVNACKERGITVFLVNQSTGFREENEISGVGISSIMDTVVFLRYIDVGGEINRMLLVMKSRGSSHSNQYRELLITDDGIRIADIYAGAGGVLTGVARQEQEARENLERRMKEVGIERKELEVRQKEAVLEAETARLKVEVEAANSELQVLRLEQGVSQTERIERAGMRDDLGDLLETELMKPN